MAFHRTVLLTITALLLWTATVSADTVQRVEVTLTGVGGEMLQTVRENLSLLREADHPRLTEYRIRTLHRRAEDEIRRSLQPFGYYEPVIESELAPTDGLWRAAYLIRPGTPVHVSTVDLRLTGPGEEEPAFVRWREGFPLQAGDRLLHQPYEEAKRDLQRIAREKGYFEAQLTEQTIRVDLDSDSAAIRLHLATGPRYRFGEVTFSELPLSEELLQRFLPFQPGEPYDAAKVFELQQALYDATYFNRVDVIPHTEAAVEGPVPISVELEMRNRTRYAAGAGYGTDTGPRLTFGLDRRWVNRRGHRFGAELVASGLGTTVSGEYRIPLEQPSTDYLGLSAGWEDVETDTSDRRTSTIGIGVTRALGRWLRTLSVNYQREDFLLAGERNRSDMLIGAADWQRLEADDRLFPRRGWRFSGGVRGAAEALGSDTDFVQVQLRGKVVHPFAGGRLLVRGDLGATEVEAFERLPASLRFFAGGDQSVRGFALDALGPTNDAGQVIGGRYLLVGSVEYDRYFNDRFGAALFYDAGNAFNTASDYTLEQAVGVGLRIRLPFGVVRVDAASAVSVSGNPWRLHVTIGPDL